MYSAEVAFARERGVVMMTLSMGGNVVATSASQETIARELQIRGVRWLAIDGLFTTELPTTEKTLAAAASPAPTDGFHATAPLPWAYRSIPMCTETSPPAGTPDAPR